MKRAILYLHGFQSSPLSFKAQLIGQALAERKSGVEYFCPQLPLSPAKSIEIAADCIRNYPGDMVTVIGSSLGGFYANRIAEDFHCRAILINPVIDPWKIKILEDIPDRSDLRVREWLEFRENYQSELEAIRVDGITDPGRYLLFAAKGDELLDWKLMQSHYQQANQVVVDGCDHGFSTFAQYIDQTFQFCGVQH